MTDLSPETAGKLVALVQDIARFGAYAPDGSAYEDQARAIVAELPEPTDPDLLEARQIAADMMAVAHGATHVEETRNGERDGYVHVCIALAAIERGRQLGSQSVSDSARRALAGGDRS